MTLSTVGLLALGVALVACATQVRSRGVLVTLGLTALVPGVALGIVGLDAGTVLVVALVIPTLALLLALSLAGTRKALAAGREPVRGGAEGLIGRVGVVRRPLDPIGQVVVDGELWRARRSWADDDARPPAEGDSVVIERVHGLTLAVRHADPWEVEP
jgi:membrane-bound ClpP family serine protease